MIRLANINDVDRVMKIISDSKYITSEDNNPQWSPDYPSEKDILSDIVNKSLYVFCQSSENKNTLLGTITLNFNFVEQYSDVDWSKDSKATIIHRVAVHTEYRNSGICSVLIKFAEEFARKNGTFYIKTDTCSTNISMRTVLLKNNFSKKGEFFLDHIDYPFECYEKILE